MFSLQTCNTHTHTFAHPYINIYKFVYVRFCVPGVWDGVQDVQRMEYYKWNFVANIKPDLYLYVCVCHAIQVGRRMCEFYVVKHRAYTHTCTETRQSTVPVFLFVLVGFLLYFFRLSKLLTIRLAPFSVHCIKELSPRTPRGN